MLRIDSQGQANGSFEILIANLKIVVKAKFMGYNILLIKFD